MGTISTLFFLANIIIAMIKKKIGMINVTNKSTSGSVTTDATKNNIPDNILIFIEISAKNEMSKQIIKYTITAKYRFVTKLQTELY